MQSDAVSNPADIESIIENHLNEQDELVKKRLEILQQLNNFKVS